MNTFLALKHLHMLSVALLGLLFLFRGVLLVNGSALLQARPLRILPHAVSAFLLASGFGMVMVSAALPVWVISKLILLVFFILCGVMAFQRADKRSSQLGWLVLGLLTYAFIASIAVTHQPLGLLG